MATCKLLLLVCVVCGVGAEETEAGHWLDVTDPLSWETKPEQSCAHADQDLLESQEVSGSRPRAALLKRIKQLEAELDQWRYSPGDVLLKHVLRGFAENMHIDLDAHVAVHKEALVSLSGKDVKLLANYLASKTDQNDVVLRENLRNALSAFIVEVSRRNAV